MKKNIKKNDMALLKYILGALLVIVGLGLNFFNIGKAILEGYIVLGSMMIYIGSTIILATFLTTVVFKKSIFDERMAQADNKANRIAWWFIYFSISLILYIDSVKPINVPIGSFLLYYLAAISLIRFMSYKIILKIN